MANTMARAFLATKNTEPRSRGHNVDAQPQRTGNEALAEAVTQIASECSFRAGEWSRAGDAVMAQAFERVGAVVGGIEK